MKYSTRQDTSSGLGARMLFDLLTDHGQTTDEIERVCGISRVGLNDPRFRFPLSNLSKLFRHASQITNDPALGLHLMPTSLRTPLTLITNIAINSESILEGIRNLANYLPIDTSNIFVELTENDEQITIEIRNQTRCQEVWILEIILSTLLSFCRAFVGNGFTPLEVKCAYPVPPYTDEYRLTMGIPVRFCQPANLIVLPRKPLETRIPSANPYLKEYFISIADEIMIELNKADLYSNQVVHLIKKNLGRKAVSARTIAAEMGVNRSTMGRNLKIEGVSFSGLFDQIRQNMAIAQLAEGHSVKNVSCQLGYSDSSSFQHAFKKWFAVSPGKRKLD